VTEISVPQKIFRMKGNYIFFTTTKIKLFAQFNFVVDRFLSFLSQIWSNFILRLEKYGKCFFKFGGRQNSLQPKKIFGEKKLYFSSPKKK
jgi:hypothetical protein